MSKSKDELTPPAPTPADYYEEQDRLLAIDRMTERYAGELAAAALPLLHMECKANPLTPYVRKEDEDVMLDEVVSLASRLAARVYAAKHLRPERGAPRSQLDLFGRALRGAEENRATENKS